MGASVVGTGRGSRKRGSLAEINVTPLVDVVLVLLIIFMVTAVPHVGEAKDLARHTSLAARDHHMRALIHGLGQFLSVNAFWHLHGSHAIGRTLREKLKPHRLHRRARTLSENGKAADHPSRARIQSNL